MNAMLEVVGKRATRRWIARVSLLVAGLALIVTWQRGFTKPEAKIDPRFKVTASTGINREAQFVFFLYHLRLFPIATDAPIKADTRDEAWRQLRENPGAIKQDEGSTFRSGDRGRTFLYLLDSYLNHRGVNASIKPAHFVAFTFALCALWTAFWAMRRYWAGAALCLLIGSNPFQLSAVYLQENVFSWPITALTLLLAINLPLMMRRRWEESSYPLVAAALTGLALALIRTVRSEPTPLLFSAVLVYLTTTGLPKIRKAHLVGVLALSFALTSWGSIRYLDGKLAQSKAVVARYGGSPYTGPVVAYHEFWHVIFCGLGDYDTKYGYAWDDRAAYRHTYPELQARNPDLKLDPSLWIQRWTYDEAGKYPYFYAEAPGYDEIIRKKIFGDIRKDPGWFLGILKKRAWRVLTETTPVAVALSDEHYETSGPILGLACVPLALFLALSRRWFELKLLAFAAPLSAGPLLIYSDRGMCFYSCFHVFGAFVFGSLVASGARLWYRRRRAG